MVVSATAPLRPLACSAFADAGSGLVWPGLTPHNFSAAGVVCGPTAARFFRGGWWGGEGGSVMRANRSENTGLVGWGRGGGVGVAVVMCFKYSSALVALGRMRIGCARLAHWHCLAHWHRLARWHRLALWHHYPWLVLDPRSVPLRLLPDDGDAGGGNGASSACGYLVLPLRVESREGE